MQTPLFPLEIEGMNPAGGGFFNAFYERDLKQVNQPYPSRSDPEAARDPSTSPEPPAPPSGTPAGSSTCPDPVHPHLIGDLSHLIQDRCLHLLKSQILRSFLPRSQMTFRDGRSPRQVPSSDPLRPPAPPLLRSRSPGPPPSPPRNRSRCPEGPAGVPRDGLSASGWAEPLLRLQRSRPGRPDPPCSGRRCPQS